MPKTKGYKTEVKGGKQSMDKRMVMKDKQRKMAGMKKGKGIRKLIKG